MFLRQVFSRALRVGCAFVFVLALAIPAEADFCVGRNCGPTELGPEAHCHAQNDQGNQCWDELDNTCENVPGFEGLGPASCLLEAPTEAGLSGQQNLVLSGYNQFRTQVLQPATSRAEERDLEAAEEEAAEDDDEDDGRPLAYLSQITTALEYEDWELAGNPGETVGARFGWSRQAESGFTLGASASYQDSSPDRGESSQLFNGQFSFGQGFATGDTDWSWAAFGSFSDVSGPASDTLIGGGARIAFTRHLDGGMVLSGGALAQYQRSDELEDDPINIGAGAGFGMPLGDRFALDFELYAVNVIEPEVDDDFFYTGAGMFSIYFSPRFALTLGARLLEGIDDLDSITYTVGQLEPILRRLVRIMAVALGAAVLSIAASGLLSAQDGARPTVLVLGLESEVEEPEWRDRRLGMGLRGRLAQMLADSGAVSTLEERELAPSVRDAVGGYWLREREDTADRHERLDSLHRETGADWIAHGELASVGVTRDRVTGLVGGRRWTYRAQIRLCLHGRQGESLCREGRGKSVTRVMSVGVEYRSGGVAFDQAGPAQAVDRALIAAFDRLMPVWEKTESRG